MSGVEQDTRNAQVRGMEWDSYKDWRAGQCERLGRPVPTIPDGFVCGYCGERRLHDEWCRNPWDLRGNQVRP